MQNFLKGSFSKSFSLIELIFIILLIAIILSVALPRFFSSVDETTFVKLKSDIATIRGALKDYKNSQIVKNISYNLDNLEVDENYLFSAVVDHRFPITQSYPSWSKKSSDTYIFHFSQQEQLEFFYDKVNLTFLCDTANELCKKALE